MLGLAAAAVLGAALVLGPLGDLTAPLRGGEGAALAAAGAPAATPAATPADAAAATLALVTYDPDRDDEAVSIQVLTVDPVAGTATSLLVPPATLAEVPGAGDFPLAEAYAFGGGRTLHTTLDHLLGVRLDGVATLPLDGWGALTDGLDGLDVEVAAPTPIAVGTDAERLLPAGRHQLTGTEVVALLASVTSGDGELDRLPRAHRVFDAVLARVAADPDALAVVLDETVGWRRTEGTPLDGALAAAAGVRAAGGLTAVTLPTSAIGTADAELFRLDADRAAPVLTDRFGATGIGGSADLADGPDVAADGPGAAADGPDAEGPDVVADGLAEVQVLNGNGVPGIGQQVAERLRGGPHRIVLSGNADSFDHPTTRIVLHRDDAAGLALAEDLRERLGVGAIERAATPQSVADVTVVVGADFPPADRHTGR